MHRAMLKLNSELEWSGLNREASMTVKKGTELLPLASGLIKPRAQL
jgi:hypothetical protein